MVNKQQTTSKEHFASVKSFNLPISSKFAMEIASNLRNKDLKSAKRILQDSISLKRAIKFKKFTMDLAHKAGMAAGRYAVDACKQVLELLDSVEANAEFKGFVGNVENYLPEAVFIFTSRYLGILEALAYKKFVFAHYNNEIKKDYLEMAPFSDFISISKNGEEISKELINFINHKKTINTKNGYNWAKDKTWKSMASLYLRLWNIK